MRIKLTGQGFKLLGATSVRVNLQQFSMNGKTARILVHCFEQNLFGLGITPVGHINIRFGDGVHFIGINGSRTGLAELAGMRRRSTGINRLPTIRAKHRIWPQAGGRWRQGLGQRDFGCCILLPTTIEEQASKQCQGTCTTHQRQRIFQQAIKEASLWHRLRL